MNLVIDQQTIEMLAQRAFEKLMEMGIAEMLSENTEIITEQKYNVSESR